MSASERLKALHPVDLPLTASAELLHVFPQLVAVVEAAERSVLLYSDSTATPEQNAEIYTRAMAVHDSLAALEKELGDE